MGWTNVEWELPGSPRFRRFCEVMGYNRKEGLGCLNLLWIFSQSECRSEATETEIAHWCEVKEGEESAQLIKALTDPLAQFLEREPTDSPTPTYLIIGNPKHVKRLKQLKIAAKKGGAATRERWRRKKLQESQSQDARPNGVPEAGHEQGKTEPTPGPIQCNTIQGNSIQSTQDKTLTARPRLKFDFESLYKKYPRKEGKKKGLDRCKAQIQTEAEFLELSHAIDRFIRHHALLKTEARFIPHFSTFMSSWTDWLDPETGTSSSVGGGRVLDPEIAKLRRELALSESTEDGNHPDGP